MASLQTWLRRIDIRLPGGRARAARRLARRRARHADRTRFETRVNDRPLVFSTEDEYSHSWFYSRYEPGDLHEAPVTRRIIEALDGASGFADVGSHLGWYACVAAACIGQDRVVAFEMDQANLDLLNRNLELNGLRDLACVHAAIGDRHGEVEYMTSPGRPSQLLSLGVARDETGEGQVKATVPMITLDEYFADRDTKPDVFKIDVEGAEMGVLRGAEGLLRDHARTLFIEVHPGLMRAFGESYHDLFRWLIDRGFTLERIGEMRGTGSAGPLHPVSPGARILHHSAMIRATKHA